MDLSLADRVEFVEGRFSLYPGETGEPSFPHSVGEVGERGLSLSLWERTGSGATTGEGFHLSS